MILSYFTLFVALSLSAIAAWYSIVGLTAIFATAVTPIIIMGSFLEIAKVTVTVWLHQYWGQCRILMRTYLVLAVATLAMITSMGIYGFLSKAHLDQAVPTGDVAAQLSLIDEKLRTQRENIDAARRALKQMDESVDQTMARTTDDRGAERAAALRRSQARERTTLQNDIAQAQKVIASLNEERAPVASQFRKVEAEVGPIKYIAAFIYGDNPDANLLERAVRWVIIVLVIVFDPLALTMVLAATESIKWEKLKRQPKQIQEEKPKEEQKPNTPALIIPEAVPTSPPPPLIEEPVNPPLDTKAVLVDTTSRHKEIPLTEKEVLDDSYDDESEAVKAKIKAWKAANPDDTLKHQRHLLEQGKISHLPWEDPPGLRGHGINFPSNPQRGELFLKTSLVPSELYKFNGRNWIKIDKQATDQYVYDDQYIDFLIQKIKSGEYDADLLTEAEKDQIALKLSQNNNG